MNNLAYVPSQQHRQAARLGKGLVKLAGLPICCVKLPNSEEWRPVPGYEGFYEVSSDGRFRRANDAKAYKTGHILAPSIPRSGYRIVHLVKDGHTVSYKAARFVAEAFIGERPTGWYINHIDGCKYNDGLANLEYVTPTDNMRHALRKGLIRPFDSKGEKNPNAKLTADDIISILKSAETAPLTARRFGVTPSAIRAIRAGRTWKHVSDQVKGQHQSC